MNTDENILILTDEELHNKSYTKKSRKKQLKKFYNFKKIFKIDDFSLPDYNTTTINSSYYNTLNTTTSYSPSQIILIFKKNISSYLIMKKYLQNDVNKYQQLLQEYKKKKQKINPMKIMESDFIFENLKTNGSLLQSLINNKEIQRPIEQDEINSEPNQYLSKMNESIFLNKFDYKHQNNIHINVDLLIDSGNGVYKKKSQSLFFEKLQEKFIKFHDGFINDNKYTDEFLIESLSNQFKSVIRQAKKRPFKIKLPVHHKPQMQNYNDYYLYDSADDIPSISINSISEEKDLENIVMDNILLQTNEKNRVNNVQSIVFDFEDPDEDSDKDNNNLLVPNSSLTIKSKHSNRDSPPLSTKKPKSALKEKHSFNVSDNKISTPLTKEKKLSPKKENSKETKNFNNPFITLIEKLLYCNDLFEEDYSEIKPKITDYPKISENIRFKDEKEKKIFETLNNWTYEMEYQIKKDQKEIRKFERRIKNAKLINHSSNIIDDESNNNIEYLENEDDSSVFSESQVIDEII